MLFLLICFSIIGVTRIVSIVAKRKPKNSKLQQTNMIGDYASSAACVAVLLYYILR